MLQIKNIYKQYKTGTLVQKVLDGVNLNLRDNEFVAILGPSGSGKTTLLNIIGGLDRYDDGDLIINGISTKKYKDRDWDSYRNHTIGFVFQSYNLIPHQTILSNVELALTISGVSKEQRKQRALDALEKVGLGNQGHKRPNQLSGGQMQRVAIARALVNDPDILLADEPTGALDSETSIQVMDLLKGVAKDRLVVMVTHNPELAYEYATRIVKLKDGKIQEDSDPYEPQKGELTTPQHKNMGKSSMSFLTSLNLSFNNLKTKKARTFLTAFAGSIGIIGIALILSLSTGVNQYIKNIEEETLSQYPLQIQSTGFDLTAMMGDIQSNNDATEDDSSIHISQMITNMFSTIGSNDLKSLKQALDNKTIDLSENTSAIEYTYNVAPQIYSSDSNTVRQVHPDQSFSSLGLGSSSNSNSMMSSMMSTDVFYQMPQNSNLYESQYDIKAGRWPQAYNECVLVLTENGNMSDFMLYTLGLRDFKELDQMIEQFSKEEDVTTPDLDTSYSYDQILNKTFKLVDRSSYYEYDDQYHVYKDKTEDTDYMKKIISEGEDIKIVGIVQPNFDSSVAMLKTGIAYPASLTDHVIKKAQESNIVKEQIAHPDIDVFSNKKFTVQQASDFDMNSLFSIDEQKMQNAFQFDTSKIQIDPTGFDFSSLDFNTLPAFDFNQILSSLKIDIKKEDLQPIITTIYNDFQNYLKEHPTDDPTQIPELLKTYINLDQTKNLIQNQMMDLFNHIGLTTQLQTLIQAQMQTYIESISTSLQQQITSQMANQMNLLASQLQSAISFDANTFASAITMNMNESELSSLMMSLMTSKSSSYDNNLKTLGYSDFDEPSGINIYPKDFDCKQNVINALDKYNEDMKKIDENKVISYADYVGTLMSSVTNIVNVISYVLIAFVAISLVVSSIMIGVITYISVLERKKEIGILRAIGASKKNVSQVFNAETFIIGLLAGLIGIGITLLLLIPGNLIIHHVAVNNQVNAILPIGGAIILILISVILTLLGGLIPSRKAAKEDPVTALRTD